MKQSHFTTPRTLDECYFDPRGQAIFNTTPKAQPTMNDNTLLGFFVGLTAAFAIIIILF